MSLASKPINNPQEMIGKKIGVQSTNDLNRRSLSLSAISVFCCWRTITDRIMKGVDRTNKNNCIES